MPIWTLMPSHERNSPLALSFCVGVWATVTKCPSLEPPPLRIRSEMHSVLSTSYQLVCGVFRYPSVLSTTETA